MPDLDARFFGDPDGRMTPSAARLLLDGMSLHDVALFLDHESTRTTERYAAASTDALRRSFDRIQGDADAVAVVQGIER